MNVQQVFERYCDNCPKLDAVVETKREYDTDPVRRVRTMVKQTVTVTCQHAATCARLYDNLVLLTDFEDVIELQNRADALADHLAAILKLPDCGDCGRKDCEYMPQWGKPTRINCPLHIPKEVTT